MFSLGVFPVRGFKKWMGSKPKHANMPQNDSSNEAEDVCLTSDLEENEMMIKKIFENTSDIVYRKVRIAGQTKWLVIYFSSLVEEKMISDHVLKPLIANHDQQDSIHSEVEVIDDGMIDVGTTYVTSKIKEMIHYLLSGHAVVLMRGESTAMIAKVSSTAQRSPEESSSEPVIRGPKDGFNENIATNIGLIRKRLKTPKLVIESLTLGELSQTQGRHYLYYGHG